MAGASLFWLALEKCLFALQTSDVLEGLASRHTAELSGFGRSLQNRRTKLSDFVVLFSLVSVVLS